MARRAPIWSVAEFRRQLRQDLGAQVGPLLGEYRALLAEQEAAGELAQMAVTAKEAAGAAAVLLLVQRRRQRQAAALRHVETFTAVIRQPVAPAAVIFIDNCLRPALRWMHEAGLLDGEHYRPEITSAADRRRLALLLVDHAGLLQELVDNLAELRPSGLRGRQADVPRAQLLVMAAQAGMDPADLATLLYSHREHFPPLHGLSLDTIRKRIGAACDRRT